MARVQASRKPKGHESLNVLVQACDDAHRLAKRRESSARSSRKNYHKDILKSRAGSAERQRRRRLRLQQLAATEPSPSPPSPRPLLLVLLQDVKHYHYHRPRLRSLHLSSTDATSHGFPTTPTTQDINEALRGVSRPRREFVMKVLEAAQLERRKRLRYANDWNGIWEETYKELAFTSKLDWEEMFDEDGIGSADEW
ncbi:hypothetical protein DFP72DRAFT_1075014 [Ephemerocybe angulata]|uniref:Uncharacterized protein n=1 Tax=Ephemerocybe angulata TaxID=980116 RepID=A0A8H6HKA5_9AGAR|nr:hypothetical protein DFP72DRAFT_1075014 [Tulosesus angulatus]